MAIILDADVILRGEKGTFNLAGWLASRPDDEFALAAITVAELWHGVERAAGLQRTKRIQFLETILSPLPVLPYTEHTGREHARVWAELAAGGKIIGYYDLVVAATALAHGCEVATFNRRHFRQVRGLKVVLPA